MFDKKIKYFFDEGMVADADSFSLSPLKPKYLHERVKQMDLPIHRAAFKPVTKQDLLLSHTPSYVYGIFDGSISNGFGNRIAAVNKSFLYTVGAQYAATKEAFSGGNGLAWAFCSGFHHATRNHGGGYCTFEGLSVAGRMLQRDIGRALRILIVDGDAHWGNGTVDCTEGDESFEYVSYNTRVKPAQAADDLRDRIERFKPEIVMFQDGMDAYAFDPLSGGGLTYTELADRTNMICSIAKESQIPLVINLAGGYTRCTPIEQNEGLSIIEPVLQGHINAIITSLIVYQPHKIYPFDVEQKMKFDGVWEVRFEKERLLQMVELDKKRAAASLEKPYTQQRMFPAFERGGFDDVDDRSELEEIFEHESAHENEPFEETVHKKILAILCDEMTDEMTKADEITEYIMTELI